MLRLCKLVAPTAASVRRELIGVEPERGSWLWKVWQVILVSPAPLYTRDITKLSEMHGRNTAACISALIRRGFIEPVGTTFPRRYRARAGA